MAKQAEPAESDKLDQAEQSTANPEIQPTVVKRRLKAEPESVRARTRRLQDTPVEKKRSPIRAFFWGFTWPLRKLGHAIASLERFKFFRVIGHVVVPHYFRNSWRELKLVSWPNRRTSWSLTYAVIVFSVIFGAIIAVVDFGLDKLFKELILR